VKDKEVPAPEDVEAVVEMEQYNKKRHLNVVFIGHVGRSICFTIFPK
jgi:peptide chain release factor subunit 3